MGTHKFNSNSLRSLTHTHTTLPHSHTRPHRPPIFTHTPTHLPQVRTVESAREALQQELDHVLVDLESSEAMVGELEEELEEERKRGEEEVERCETLIAELQAQLEASEEQHTKEEEKVGGA